MEKELFISKLPTWHSQEILPLEQYSSGDCNFSSSLVDKAAAAAADHNPVIKLNSHIFHPPVKNENSLIKEPMMGKMALNSSFSGRPSRFSPNRSEGRKDIEDGEIGVDLRKRKSALRLKVAEVEEDSNTKRSKQLEDHSRGCKCKVEEDYIHVRARRGQATDSHSLAERMRREKIGEKMKILQNLVPGCNKVNGKAVMLDEIINYVQSLQRQVQFLNMKLTCMNSVGNVGSSRNFNVETQVQNPCHHHLLPQNSSNNGSTIKGPLHPPGFPPMASHRTNTNHPVLPRNNEGVKIQYNDLLGDELRRIVKTGYGAYMKIQL